MVWALSLAGCSGPTEERDLPFKVDPVHQDGSQTQDQGVPEVVVRPEDLAVDLQPGLTGPVDAEWLGVSQPEVTGLQTVQLRIRNAAPVPVIINAQMVFDGFIQHTETRQLTSKPRNLAVGEEVLFTVAAKEFPIQNTTGASQFKATIRIHSKTPNGYYDREYLVTTAPVMYRHDRSFKSITVFNMDTLIKKYGGIIAGNPDKRSPDKVVGRVISSSGKMRELTELDVVAEMVDEYGRVHGTIDALGVEIVVDDPDNAVYRITNKPIVEVPDNDPEEKEGDNAL